MSVAPKKTKSVLEAVEELGGRVTAADVAGAGAADLASAERELVALAARFGSRATLEATSAGDLVFDFGDAPEKTLARVDRKERWLSRWRRWKPGFATAGRVSFGLCLFASLAVVSVALMVVSTSGESDDRRGPSSSMGGDRGFYIMPSPFTYWDLMLYSNSRPGYYDDPRYRAPKDPNEMNFLEAVFSYVFGDGDPNAAKRTLELERAAAIIRDNDGVVIAEQLAPVVADGPPAPRRLEDAAESDSVLVDESWVLPIVSALGGRAEVVGDDGTIVYIFDDLVDAAYASSKDGAASKPGPEASYLLKEAPVEFSRANEGQLAAAGALGVVNLVAVSALLAKIVAQPVVLKLVPALRVLLVPLVAYAVAFNVVPAVRATRVGPANREIERRNAARTAWARKNAKPDSTPGLRGKLRAARTAAGNALLRRRRKAPAASEADVVFSTADDAVDANRAKKNQLDLDDFDKRLSASKKDRRP